MGSPFYVDTKYTSAFYVLSSGDVDVSSVLSSSSSEASLVPSLFGADIFGSLASSESGDQPLSRVKQVHPGQSSSLLSSEGVTASMSAECLISPSSLDSSSDNVSCEYFYETILIGNSAIKNSFGVEPASARGYCEEYYVAPQYTNGTLVRYAHRMYCEDYYSFADDVDGIFASEVTVQGDLGAAIFSSTSHPLSPLVSSLRLITLPVESSSVEDKADENLRYCEAMYCDKYTHSRFSSGVALSRSFVGMIAGCLVSPSALATYFQDIAAGRVRSVDLSDTVMLLGARGCDLTRLLLATPGSSFATFNATSVYAQTQGFDFVTCLDFGVDDIVLDLDFNTENLAMLAAFSPQHVCEGV